MEPRTHIKDTDLRYEILKGKIFIYPTDTIYGIGCNALNQASVKKIRNIKQRDQKPFSIIAPSFDWIEQNCIVDINLKKYLPGPYTIILKKKDPKCLPWVSDTDTLGVRIPKSKFCKEIQKTKLPFITTSVNISGQMPANSITEVSKDLKGKVDFIIDEGTLSGKPSTLIINGKEIKR
jgi:L-threonylcarbamoyladenylate synthase